MMLMERAHGLYRRSPMPPTISSGAMRMEKTARNPVKIPQTGVDASVPGRP